MRLPLVAVLFAIMFGHANAKPVHHGRSAVDKPVEIPASGLLTNKELAAVAAKAARPHDAFDTSGNDPRINGREFRVVTPFRELTDPGGARMGRNGGWNYSVDTQTLKFTIWPNLFSPIEYQRDDPEITKIAYSGQGFTIVTGGMFMPDRVGTNAFGAARVIKSAQATTYSVGQMQHDWQSPVFPHNVPNPDPNKVLGSDPTAEVRMAPDQARAVTKGLVLAVYGTIVPYKGERNVVCGFGLKPATFDDPREVLNNNCFFNAKISRYTIEEPAHGAILAEWKNDMGS